MRQSFATRIVVILTLVLGAAGLQTLHLAMAHRHSEHAQFSTGECRHDHQSSSHCGDSHDEDSHDEDSHAEGSHAEGSHAEGSHAEGSHAEGSHDEGSCDDEQTCDTCAALLALAFESTDAPALVPTERVCDTLTTTVLVVPADCAIGANRARPPPIA